MRAALASDETQKPLAALRSLLHRLEAGATAMFTRVREVATPAHATAGD
jgi:hypothetical protein